MTCHVNTRWGGSEPNPSVDRMREVLAELDAEDDEHPDVSLSHESEWCLSVFRSGLLVWENLEEGDPKHMRRVSRDRVLELWMKLAANATHLGLYLLLIVMVVSGGLAWFGEQRWAAEAHEVLKALVLALIGLHVVGALYQQFVLKSDVLKRMGRPE